MEAAYKPTIGLEVHAELTTRTKMFCDSRNDPDEKHPNVNVCPVCLGHPGALPTANKEAIAAVIKVGLALDAKISPVSKFDRKNYFYPDLPKAYQISQSTQPLVMGGSLRGVKINHIHLEEDAGKLIHDDASDSTGSPQAGGTLVDYNRSSVPLMELVTEPDLHTADDAVALMKELQLMLRYLGVSDADLERGQMRADANISVSPTSALGTRAEVKNLNSFRAVFQAINYEIKRQTEILEKGETVQQETRGWDEAKQKTMSQRSKEEAQDYRYFPEPDLPPLETTKVFDIDAMLASLPELPAAKRVRFAKEYGLIEAQVEMLITEPALATFFENAISELAEMEDHSPLATRHSLFHYLTSDLRGLMNDACMAFSDLKIKPEHLAHLAALVDGGKLTSRQAKDVLKKMFVTGADPEDIVRDENIGVSDDTTEIEAVVLAVIAENLVAVTDYKKGKAASLQFLIGKAMGALKGRARPEMLREMFESKLKT
jgi:aspartyl-tRNA(Asn)/glutamyl-tRNA(Gln) amidotransferase subunit B